MTFCRLSTGRANSITDELYDLYKNDPDFKEYVDRWCQKHQLSIFEAFRMRILQEYGEWRKQQAKK